MNVKSWTIFCSFFFGETPETTLNRQKKKQQKNQFSLIARFARKKILASRNHDISDISDMGALILEIADKHDHMCGLRVKNRKLETRIEELEQKVKFREKIIRELRRSTKCQNQVAESFCLHSMMIS